MYLSLQDKELLRRVDEVLHYVWDPIGVAGIAQARDEYESYVPQVFNLLKGTVDGRDIAAYLQWIAVERMGLGAKSKRDDEVVVILLGWRDHLFGL